MKVKKFASMEIADIQAEGDEESEKEVIESIKAAQHRPAIFKARDDYK